MPAIAMPKARRTVKSPLPEKLLTVEEFVRNYSDRRAELIDGRVVELPMPGFKHGCVCSTINFILKAFVVANNLGRVFCNDTFMATKRRPDRARGMDVGYVSYRLIPKKRELSEGPVPVSPELVFEVRSATDRKAMIEAKTQEYLKAGVLAVVDVNPKKKTAAIHRLGEPVKSFTADDIFEVADILPGFAVPVAKFFE